MAQMRTQISLVFDDENLFNNFIVPYKEQRALNGVIIRCLKAYFYSDDAKNSIELANNADYSTESGVRDEATEQALQNIRETLLMQSFLADELEETLTQGSQDVSDILNRTNKAASDYGMAKQTKSQFNSQMLQIEMQKATLPMKDSTSTATPKADGTIMSNELMTNILLLIAKKLDIPEINSLLSSSSEPPKEEKIAEESKIESYNAPVESVKTPEEINVKNHIFAPETSPSEDEDFDILDSDAVDDMQNLLDSLDV